MTYTKNKRDGNEKSIVDFWKQCGCIWVPGRIDSGYDGLLLYRGNLYVVEIKQPKEREHLTETERNLRDATEVRGIEYHVITSVEEAAKLIDVEIF